MTTYRNFIIVALTCFLLPSCEAIGDIFSAGVWVGIVIVVIVIVALVAIFGRKK